MSMTFVDGQLPLSATVLLTRATFAAVADMAMEPVASGVGMLFTPFAPAPSPTRKDWPGWIETLGSLGACHVGPAADASWPDQPLTEPGLPPRLKISM